jgi:copper homeostasis protein
MPFTTKMGTICTNQHMPFKNETTASYPQLELATFGPENFELAQNGTINRMELCSNKLADGLTPNLLVFEQYRSITDLDIRVMIRPRAGDFCYNANEFEQMKQSIIAFKNKGANGFVFGILNNLRQIDVELNQQLVNLAAPLPCTFHKAFDQLSDYETGLQQCIQIGFQHILSSGLKANVLEGIAILKQLNQLAGDQISIIPGGGIRSSNLSIIHQQLGCKIYHSAAITNNGNEADVSEINEMLKQLACNSKN